MRKKVRSKNLKLLLVLLLMIVTVGYATLTTNLTINGTSKINNSTWNVHFNNPTPTPGSVAIDTSAYQDAKAATKDSATQVSFNILLSEPGDFYEFTVPVENEGSIDAMIDEITSTIQIGTGTVTTINSSSDLPVWLDYSITYFDGATIAAKQKLDHGTTETYKVRVEFKKDITNQQFSDAVNKELHLTFGVEYVQKDDTSVEVPHPFSSLSWETIVAKVKAGNINGIEVGDTKTVDLGTFGTHTLRVANTSTPPECSTNGFSQTACGFVLEFADIITTHIMNPYDSNDTTTNGVNNKGGWEYSEMRTYVNSDIYNALPTALKNAIINTRVVSGHGSNDFSNFTTDDKLYLLSTKEVWGKEGTSNTIISDTAEAETRQLDYYKSQNVTTSSYAGAIKKNETSDSAWWLRSAPRFYDDDFFRVRNTGSWNSYIPGFTCGVSPAFRLG